ncbi:hypothetical protein LCGC14_0461600 [marine sediment metagenome]|uniref:Uncharacterized protein n=1 Tax=marine sediment metagenome TaxID=412755 RepID=A0A0F9SXR8_9ZZZZ
MTNDFEFKPIPLSEFLGDGPSLSPPVHRCEACGRPALCCEEAFRPGVLSCEVNQFVSATATVATLLSALRRRTKELGR